MPSTTAPPMATDTVWTPAQYAEYIGISTQVAAHQRYRGNGPKYVRMGPRTIRYRKSDVDAWLEQNVETQTSGAA